MTCLFSCRDTYTKYDEHFRYGSRTTGRKFNISEFTVRGFVKAYDANKNNAETTKSLTKGKRGRSPLLPSDIDEKVLEMMRNMRGAGAVTNFHTLIALARGIVIASDRTLLTEHGGTIEFIIGWCQSIFKRLNFVR